MKEEKREVGEKELKEKNSGVSCSNLALPCMDKLREELSCAVRISQIVHIFRYYFLSLIHQKLNGFFIW